MRLCRNWTAPMLMFAGVALITIGGCGWGELPMAAVEGKVLYRGEPLQFGNVIFQPQEGPPAQGRIQSDGTFRLSTQHRGDGAVLGNHRVSISCNEVQRPNNVSLQSTPEPGVGRSLIPRKYVTFASSGLTAKVEKTNEPFIFDLRD